MPKKPIGFWTYQRCLKVAKSYTKIVEWAKCSEGRASYLAAYRNGWHRAIGIKLGHNIRLKVTAETVGADHDWWWNAFATLHRIKTT